MAEQQEVKGTATEEKESCNKHKCKVMHKVFGLKGLSLIYKVLSILVITYLIYLIGLVWYTAFKSEDGDKLAYALLTLQYVLSLGFLALILITISRVLKTLKKIKHAVEHK